MYRAPNSDKWGEKPLDWMYEQIAKRYYDAREKYFVEKEKDKDGKEVAVNRAGRLQRAPLGAGQGRFFGLLRGAGARAHARVHGALCPPAARKERLLVLVSADSFLHHMVRKLGRQSGRDRPRSPAARVDGGAPGRARPHPGGPDSTAPGAGAPTCALRA
jgi:hypothetical protein